MSVPVFNELKKMSKKDSSGLKQIKIAVLGDCATQHISTAVKGYGYFYGMGFEIFDADYDQIDAQTMDTGSELYAFAPKYILIYNCTQKLYQNYLSCPIENRASFARNVYSRMCAVWERIASVCGAKIIQTNFPEEDDSVFGNYSSKIEGSFINQLRELNVNIAAGSRDHNYVFTADICGIRALLGREKFNDDKIYYIAKLPASTDAIPYIAKAVTDIVSAAEGRIKKCAVLDLDNTLWGGVIGDDGLEGIEIGELGKGHAFSDLQHWLKELKERGIILAVCSKNNEENARLPFEKHPEMVLRLDDISMFVANWEDKASNIKKIQATLNIGMDSMVFIDDNPFERNLVRTLIPDICVPELPEDPAEYLAFLKSLNLFETASYSEGDRDRTKQYQAEIGRVALMERFASFDDYLKELDMRAKVSPFDKFSYPRISQLTQRSNQFNLRTVRYTESEIEHIAGDDRYLTLYFCLRDKFGDHGLISVVILEKKENSTLFIHEWLMSCRVLKRGMEEFIINSIIDCAKEHGFKTVVGEYIKTPKNAMVENIYEKLGFRAEGNGLFTADTVNFNYNKTFIVKE